MKQKTSKTLYESLGKRWLSKNKRGSFLRSLLERWFSQFYILYLNKSVKKPTVSYIASLVPQNKPHTRTRVFFLSSVYHLPDSTCHRKHLFYSPLIIFQLLSHMDHDHYMSMDLFNLCIIIIFWLLTFII